jgi:hypothetical protein
LDKKLVIFKKFERLMDGGSLFNYPNYIKSNSKKNCLKTLFDSKLNAFKIS